MNRYPNLEIIKKMDEKHIPDLSVVTLGALELFSKEGFPKVKLPDFKNPAIAGSGNAKITARILLSGKSAVYANESNYRDIAKRDDIDGAIVFSASGEKHAPLQVMAFLNEKIDTYLVTCTEGSEATKLLDEDKIIVTPKNREPYTYNTSTYLGWLFALTGEDPQKILHFINLRVKPIIPDNIKEYKGFLLITPDKFQIENLLFETKFIELFGRRLARDVKTFEELKHAITVVPYDKELCIQFGEGKNDYDGNILKIPLPQNASYASMMAIGYFVIGQIQKQQPQYFKDNIINYTKKAASKIFGKGIKTIVE